MTSLIICCDDLHHRVIVQKAYSNFFLIYFKITHVFELLNRSLSLLITFPLYLSNNTTENNTNTEKIPRNSDIDLNDCLMNMFCKELQLFINLNVYFTPKIIINFITERINQ